MVSASSANSSMSDSSSPGFSWNATMRPWRSMRMIPSSRACSRGTGFTADATVTFDGLEVMYGQMSVLHVPTGSDGAGPPVVIGHSGSDGTIAWAFPELDLVILYFTQSRGGLTPLRLEGPIQRLLLSEDEAAD